MNIEQLTKLSDEELSKRLGFPQKLKAAKEGIAELASLEGYAREEAEERVKKMFEPNIYENEFEYIADDAKRKAKKEMSGEEQMACCEPHSMMD